jgi:hypothetical protein
MSFTKKGIISVNKFSKCAIKKCKPDEKTIAYNYKVYKDYINCLKKSKTKKQYKKCDNPELKKIKEQNVTCVEKKCNKEKKEYEKILDDAIKIKDKLRQKRSECTDKECTKLIKERAEIEAKCEKIKSNKKFFQCRKENNIHKVSKKIEKCTKKKCAKLHKELSSLSKEIDKIYNELFNIANKNLKENEKIYKKYYSNKSKKLTSKKSIKGKKKIY